jgi:hypothetical protein
MSRGRERGRERKEDPAGSTDDGSLYEGAGFDTIRPAHLSI